ncbi:hypothetical protein AURDEDRAFT_116984 [Auricularia subglabra TFB-10046 SS5]|uniref:Uncharacterized protein n=1 Tax=Auricularia subglabra (strain TFB-10046 / SS5) TaxID=717982 RepID=J0LGQ2_AURST|nr:hypothetical protein AURDEDRAFT_116984 [Auricularia subglabra TFB-10046 SS5]
MSGPTRVTPRNLYRSLCRDNFPRYPPPRCCVRTGRLGRTASLPASKLTVAPSSVRRASQAQGNHPRANLRHLKTLLPLSYDPAIARRPRWPFRAGVVMRQESSRMPRSLQDPLYPAPGGSTPPRGVLLDPRGAGSSTLRSRGSTRRRQYSHTSRDSQQRPLR